MFWKLLYRRWIYGKINEKQLVRTFEFFFYNLPYNIVARVVQRSTSPAAGACPFDIEKLKWKTVKNLDIGEVFESTRKVAENYRHIETKMESYCKGKTKSCKGWCYFSYFGFAVLNSFGCFPRKKITVYVNMKNYSAHKCSHLPLLKHTEWILP